MYRLSASIIYYAKNMEPLPGTYLIHNLRANVVVDLNGQYKPVSWGPHKGLSQQWRIQRSTRGYALKSALCDDFLGINDTGRGSRLERVCEHNASIWIMEHHYDDVYTILIIDTQMCLSLPEGQDAPGANLLITEKKLTKGQLWRFEKLSDDSGGVHHPRNPVHFYPQPSGTLNSSNPSAIVSGSPNSPYIDDAHLHTDMLFNMPRHSFTRIQRAAALEWARKLGATNVPTLESFDECERQMEAGQSISLDGNTLAYNMKRE
ncbi:hypothetical protein BDV93DRAFT_520409 [Ceratobasidium sp. AG-I]|nr:hypothetical protein BDV93DRAFT_520409 [Ceratobasidium sp. AG-I]